MGGSAVLQEGATVPECAKFNRRTCAIYARHRHCYEYCDRFGASERDTVRYAKWVWERFAIRIRRHVDMRAVRATFAKALGADPWTLAIARRIPGQTGAVTLPTSVATYNLVARHRLAFETLEREAPNLIPLFGALAQDLGFLSSGKPTQTLRQFLIGEHGIKERTWRMLVRGRGRFLSEFLPFYHGEVPAATLDLIRLTQELQLRDLPPRWLLEGFMEHHGGRGRTRREYSEGHEYRSAAWRRLALLAARGGQPPDSRAHTLARILVWLHDTDAPPTDRTARLASWQWFERKAMDFHFEEAIGHVAAKLTWSMPFELLAPASLCVTPILDARSLWQEATSMRNCVDTYVDKCMAGEALICTARRLGKAKSEAHLLFERTAAGWRLSDIGAFANGLVPESVKSAIHHWHAGEPFTAEVTTQLEDSL